MADRDECAAQVSVAADATRAFFHFLALGAWWPRTYSWSGDSLEDMRLDARVDGLLSEIGPHGFRCDFGRVLAIDPPRRLVFTWQIGPQRDPQPDPARASTVEVVFSPDGRAGTTVTVTHRDFRNHGGEHDGYRAAMGSDMGWPYLLRCFAERL